jgi:hypothetical protein
LFLQRWNKEQRLVGSESQVCDTILNMIYLDLEFQDCSSWHSKTLQQINKKANGNKLIETS